MKRMSFLMLCLLPTLAFAAGGDWVTRALDQRSPGSALTNPAFLGSYSAQRWGIELPGGGGAISNNAFSIGFWNTNIAGDDYWDASETQAILDRIPSDGLKVSGGVTAPIIGVRYKQFAFNAQVWGGARADVPKSIAELAFVGTKLNERYAVRDLIGQSAVVSDYALSWGHVIPQRTVPELSAGLTAHYYAGHFYTDAQNLTADLYTTRELIQGSGEFSAITASQGGGFGMDAGLAAVLSSRYRINLAVQGIGARMGWNIDETTTTTFSTNEAGLNLDSLDNRGYTDRTFASDDTTIKGGTTHSNLPLIVRVGGLFYAHPQWTVAGLFGGILNDSPWAEQGLEAGAAGAWKPLRWAVIEGGLLAGGPHRTMFTIGGGLRFAAYALDINYTMAGGLFNSAHGAGIALRQHVQF